MITRPQLEVFFACVSKGARSARLLHPRHSREEGARDLAKMTLFQISDLEIAQDGSVSTCCSISNFILQNYKSALVLGVCVRFFLPL
jgi:hypothetical protein